MLKNIKNPKTRECALDMLRLATDPQSDGLFIVCMFSWSHGQATASAAIRALRKAGLVEIAYYGGDKTPNYRAVELSAHQRMALRSAA